MSDKPPVTKVKPTTAAAYLAALPPERKEALTAIRKTINANLPKGYKEGMQYGMIAWFVPHSVYPKGYHCDAKQPLPFLSLASQKNHMAAYLFCLYCDADGEVMARFQETWESDTGKLDMGKSCVRFKNLEQVSLKAIGDAVKAMPVEKFVASYEAAWVTPRAKAGGKAGGTVGGKKSTAEKVVKKSAAKKVSKKRGG